MLLQENEKIIINFTNEEILIMILSAIIFIIIIIAMFIYVYTSGKLHDQYHKGYDKAKDDKVQYYKTIRELIDSFEKMYTKLKSDNPELSVETMEYIIDYKDKLQEYYS